MGMEAEERRGEERRDLDKMDISFSACRLGCCIDSKLVMGANGGI